mgnify:CR=1 FL=1
MKAPIIVIGGPTASGKTGLAVELCRRFPLEIISVDSALVYRGMDIGTDKATLSDRERVPHHMLDLLDPTEDFSAGAYESLARQALEEIVKQQRLQEMFRDMLAETREQMYVDVRLEP